MKHLFLLIPWMLISLSVKGQSKDENPYAIFGGNPYVAGCQTENKFIIENISDKSGVSKIEHNPITGQVLLRNSIDQIIKEIQLQNIESGWHSMDPLAEKYYSISPYVYCANNPIRYVDLRGDSLTLVGDASGIQETSSTYNSGLGGFYTTSADATGKMSISPVEGTDPNKMTAEEKAYYSVLNRVISGTDGMTTINVVNGTSVVIGDVDTSTIDIGDIQALGNGTDVNQGSALLHETIEQYGIQVKGQTSIMAHLNASGVERIVTGSYVDPINRFLDGGQLSVPILDQTTGNPLKTVIIYVNNKGNVTGIKR